MTKGCSKHWISVADLMDIIDTLTAEIQELKQDKPTITIAGLKITKE